MLMYSPNTARVLASCSSMGVPCEPHERGVGQRVSHVTGKPVDEVVLAAVGLVRDDHDVTPV